MDTWGLRGTLAAVAVATVVAGVGGAAVYAATGAGGGFAASSGHGGPPPGFSPPTGTKDATATVHGESVVSDGKGGFTVELSQNGTITAIDAASVTARSTDGFVQRYVIPPSAATPPFHIGDVVAIRATRVGADATISSLR